MSTTNIRKGVLIAQDVPECMEHSIVIQRYEGCVSIMQNGSDVIVADDHVAEFIKALRQVARDQP